MDEMTWPDIKAAIKSGFTTVVVGVGATEQHARSTIGTPSGASPRAVHAATL
jgi:creatinine amidohydrolase/Fe(II)-dependent formamide hydrolase-like protein